MCDFNNLAKSCNRTFFGIEITVIMNDCGMHISITGMAEYADSQVVFGCNSFNAFDKLCDPDPTVRSRIAALLSAAAARGREAILIVNNKAEGSAPLSIAALAEQMVG